MAACINILEKAFPSKKVQGFAAVRTISFGWSDNFKIL